jgi:hypothetical protein
VKLEQLLSGLGDGPIWVTGAWLKQLVAAIIEDRARLVEGTGDEIPTPWGRFLNVRGSGKTATFNAYFAVSGQIKLVELTGRVIEDS